MSSTALVQTPSSTSQLQQRPSAQQNGAPSQAQGAVTSTPNQKQGTPATKPNTGALTPQQLLQRPSPARSTPGKWEHPRMAEIQRRQHLTTFDQTNARQIIASGAVLLASLIVPAWIKPALPRSLLSGIPESSVLVIYGIQILLLANIFVALLPLIRPKDNMEDIPLTPQQRALLDLPPMSRPATPQEQAAWVTPPRYSRNTTPNSLDSLMVNVRSTPLSARGSPGQIGSPASSTMRVASGAQYAASPLGGRTPEAGKSRRDSLGSGRGSPLDKDAVGSILSKSSRASTGLNSKWLYERGKSSPLPAEFLGSGWGTGSVFN